LQDSYEFWRIVELHVPDKAEPVTQRPGQQAGPRGGPHQREWRNLERDRGGTRTFADHNVHPEVLHRHVEQFLCRSGDPVDLIDEDDVAGPEVRQQRGEVSGALDRWTAGDP
jgi:hypothetical protein